MTPNGVAFSSLFFSVILRQFCVGCPAAMCGLGVMTPGLSGVYKTLKPEVAQPTTSEGSAVEH